MAKEIIVKLVSETQKVNHGQMQRPQLAYRNSQKNAK